MLLPLVILFLTIPAVLVSLVYLFSGLTTTVPQMIVSVPIAGFIALLMVAIFGGIPGVIGFIIALPAGTLYLMMAAVFTLALGAAIFIVIM